jgi:hypothetical protein
MASATINPNSFAAHIRDPNVPLRPFFTPPTNEPSLPFPGYDFPRLYTITHRLKLQFDNPEGIPARQRVLSMPLEDFMFFKNLVSVIETSRRGTAPSGVEDTENRGFIKINYEILLLLISRLKKFSAKVQLEEFYRVVSVIEDFGNIETCLIKQYANVAGRETLFKLLYALDKAFEKWIYNLLEHTKSVGTSKWNQYFVEYRNELRQDLLQFTTNAEHVNICFAVQPSIVNKTASSQSTSAFGRRSRDFYVTVRNNFMLCADYVGMYIPLDVHIFFQYLQHCGEIVCEKYKTVESLAELADALGDVGLSPFETFSKSQAKVFLLLLKSYCALTKEVTSNNVVQGMVAVARGYQYTLTREEENHRIIQIAYKVIAKAEKEARRKDLSAKNKEQRVRFQSGLLSTLDALFNGPVKAQPLSPIVEGKEESNGGTPEDPFGDDDPRFLRGDATFTSVGVTPGQKIERSILRNVYHDLRDIARNDPIYAIPIIYSFIYAGALKKNPATVTRKVIENGQLIPSLKKLWNETEVTPELKNIMNSFIELDEKKLAYNMLIVPAFMKKHNIKMPTIKEISEYSKEKAPPLVAKYKKTVNAYKFSGGVILGGVMNQQLDISDSMKNMTKSQKEVEELNKEFGPDELAQLKQLLRAKAELDAQRREATEQVTGYSKHLEEKELEEKKEEKEPEKKRETDSKKPPPIVPLPGSSKFFKSASKFLSSK